MKYLKRFNESKTWDDIKDICLELKDMDLEIKYSLYQINSTPPKYKPCLYMPSSFILNNDIYDCLLRLKDYLGDNYDEMLIMSHAWAKADFEKYNNKRVLGVVILFKDEIEGSPEGDGGSGLSFLKDIYEI